MQNESSFDSWLSIANPMSGKILAKFLFWSYCPKCSWPIILQDSFKGNVRKKIRDEADFLSADKHQSFLQFGAIAFGGYGQMCPKYKMISLQCLCNISRKSWGINIIFFMKINIKVFCKLVASFLLVITNTINLSGHGQTCPSYPK